jgi:glycerol-3-phosphate dehydrogenase
MLRLVLHSGRAGHRRALGRLRSITSETSKLPNRGSVIAALRAGEEFDLLIIGAGATGSGAALDAAQRGLKVACIEREDFASGTSSRSTKLLWGGSRYLVQAFVTLLSTSLIKNPIATVRRFVEDFTMVMNCHRERVFMLKQQPHLTKWLPIAVPLDRYTHTRTLSHN